METYYHVTLEENRESIIKNGLQPTDAPECSCEYGVHVAGNIVEARHWVGRLRNERDQYYAEFIILKGEVDSSYDVREDEFVGHGPDGYVICTETAIPPSNVRVTEWL